MGVVDSGEEMVVGKNSVEFKIQNEKAGFERISASLNPNYENLISKGGFVGQFARDMLGRFSFGKISYDEALKFKKTRVPSMQGLSIISSMCVIYEDYSGDPVIMLPDRDFLPRRHFTHEDIYESWKGRSVADPNGERSKLFEKLRQPYIKNTALNGYIIESTAGRQLVISNNNGVDTEKVYMQLNKIKFDYGLDIAIDTSSEPETKTVANRLYTEVHIENNADFLRGVISDKSLSRYRRLIDHLYNLKDGVVVENSQNFNFVKEMDELASKIRMQK